MNLIKERDARTKKRKKAKQKFDREITLSSALPLTQNKCTLSLDRSEGDVRLLDEGSIVTADNNLDFYIKKGVFRKFMAGKNTKLTLRSIYGDIAEKYFEDVDTPLNIDEKYEGTINVGHNDFSTFPFIIGTWTVDDLSLVNNGDGRKGLDVDLKLNEAHPFVQAFRVQGIPLGVSVEMYMHFDDKATKEWTEKRGDYTPVVDEIFISDFAVVGECGNVGSSDSVVLRGGVMENEKTLANEELELEEVAEENEMSEEEMPTEEEMEEVAEKVAETVEEPVEESEIKEEAEEEDETADEEVGADEVEEDEESEDDEVTLSMVLDKVNSLSNKIADLVSQNEALKKQNRKLKNKLQTKNEEEKKFFQGLSISLGVDTETKAEEPKPVKKTVSVDYATGDGIGE